MNTLTRTQSTFFFSLLLIAGALVLFIFRFYLTPLVLAISLAIVFYPLYRWFRESMNMQKDIAALLVMLLVVVIVIVPLSFFGKRIVGEITSVYTLLTETSQGAQLVDSVVGFAEKYFPQVRIDNVASAAQEFLQRGAGWMLRNVGTFFSATAQFIGDLFLALFAFYYFLRDGERFQDWYLKLSPLSDEDNRAILKKLAQAISSTIRGNVIIAIIQGMLAGVGFVIFGVPHAFFWGMLSVLAAVVPMVGTAVILVPAVLYLWFANAAAAAVGLLLWGIILVGLFDNFVRPYLIEREMKAHPLLVLLSVLGGIASFGAVGFIVGPLILALFMALLDIYPNIALES